ncbi:MAG: hypothetical protein ACI9Y7_000791 [Dokdonia sp.]|jgi:hypothetical protein
MKKSHLSLCFSFPLLKNVVPITNTSETTLNMSTIESVQFIFR